MKKPMIKRKEGVEFEISANEPVFTTGVVCRLLAMPVWVLKLLDKEGIVSPPREYEGKARLYSKKELVMVKHCWYYIREHEVQIKNLRLILQLEQGNFKSQE